MSLRQRTPLLSAQPVSKPQEIEYLLKTLDEKVDCHPVYQRDIRWPQENMCDLIATIMNSGLIPGLLMYLLHPGDEKIKPTTKYECVDGQHRFFTLSHFFYGRLVELPGKKPFLISWNHRTEDGQITHVFYAETEDTKTWIAENSSKKWDYMTEEERDHFNSFLLDVRQITDKLDLQQRREIFCSLQKGVPVRGSDLYKNFTHLRLVKYISEEKRWEAELKEPMLDRLTTQPKQYWLHWMIRLYFMLNCGSSGVEEMFVRPDSEITRMMKAAHPVFNSTDATESDLEDKVSRFFGFLYSLPHGVKFPPTHFFALFAHLCTAKAGREEILHGHMLSWSKDGVTKEQKKMWEHAPPAERVDLFLNCLDQLKKIRVPAADPTAKKTIPKKIRGAVWRKMFGTEIEGKCYCCSDKITVDNWHQGHIVSRACGGNDVEANLRPVCASCNLSMGVENMEEFKARCYSD